MKSSAKHSPESSNGNHYRKRSFRRYNSNQSNVNHNKKMDEDCSINMDEIDPQTIFMLKDFRKKSQSDLLNLAASLEIDNITNLSRNALIFMILKNLLDRGGVICAEGILEIIRDEKGSYGFLRLPQNSYAPNEYDVYVHGNIIQQYGLKNGDSITGPVRSPQRSEQYFALIKINNVNNIPLKEIRNRVEFDDLTPIYPNSRLIMESSDSVANTMSGRVIDIVAPLGKGQRALLVAPPRTGKTILMQNLAHAISANYPEMHLIMLLIGERPEEVTDMTRSVKGEVISSTFDESSQRHVDLAELVIERAKRLVEQGKDVVVLMDSITRLARAYNDVVRSSGKVLSGGVDSSALRGPKKLFGAARNIEEGGSLTIIGTALVETGSKMDEVIFEEFKGTGNSEIILERRISDKRIYPAIDITKSGTRKDDLLLSKILLNKTWIFRKFINTMNSVEAIEFLISRLKATTNNAEFFEKMGQYQISTTQNDNISLN